jgi:hypothetical protein
VGGLTDEESKQVYAQLRAEIKEIDFADWYSFVTEGTSSRQYSYNSTVSYISYEMPDLFLQSNVGVVSYSVRIPLSGFLPKTASLCMSLYNKQDAKDKAVELLQKGAAGPKGANININFIDPAKNESQNAWYSLDDHSPRLNAGDERFLKTLAEAIKTANISHVDVRKPFAYISVSLPTGESETTYDGYTYYPHTEHYSLYVNMDLPGDYTNTSFYNGFADQPKYRY